MVWLWTASSPVNHSRQFTILPSGEKLEDNNPSVFNPQRAAALDRS
jgi:hypothetical protein